MSYRKLLVALTVLAVASAVTAPVALSAPPEPGFSKSTAIDADFGTTLIDSTNAPRSIRQGCGDTKNDHAVWFKFETTTPATITADTTDSFTDELESVDTVLAVYARGKRIDCNDDIDSTNHWSRVTLSAEAGTTYYFSVASFDQTTGGIIRLNLIAS